MSSMLWWPFRFSGYRLPLQPSPIESRPNKIVRRNVRDSASYTIVIEFKTGASEFTANVGAAHMNRMGFGRLILTGILLMQSVLGFALDWSGNHLLNPLWHP